MGGEVAALLANRQRISAASSDLVVMVAFRLWRRRLAVEEVEGVLVADVVLDSFHRPILGGMM